MNLTFKKVVTVNELEECWKLIYKVSIYMHENLGFSNWYPPTSFDQFSSRFQEDEVFTVIHESKSIGTFIISEKDKSYPEPIWDSVSEAIVLTKLTVAPEYQSRGIGDLCLAYVNFLGKIKNKKKVLLDALGNNPKLNDFYLRNGYKSMKERVIVTSRSNTWNIIQYQKEII
jgi:ribosomal protein S18 acetylase RimI-like enzyme